MAHYTTQDEPTIPVTLTTGDLEIGAVEIKNATDDTRAVVGAASSAAGASLALYTADGNLHDSLGAVGAAADPDGVIHGQLRSIAENTDALPAALGSAADAASLPVTQSTEDKAVLAAMSAKLPASLGIKAAAASLSVTQATEDAARMPASLGSKADAASWPVTMSTEDKAKVPALGVAASAASSPVVLASDDAHLGAVGTAADPDGVLHGQLRSIAENTDALPAALGAAAAAACLPVALSTEDAAKVPSLGGAAAAASVPVTLATEDAAKVPALGVAASAASVPVVLASDDAHLGAVGAASDVDGVLHGQLRYIGEAVDALPTALGSAADAASLPVTQSTEDKAVLAAMSAKLPASLGVKAAAASLSVTQSTEDAAVMAKLEARIAQPLLTAAPASISIGTSTASTTGLTVGTAYMVYASAPCFIKVGADAVTAATTDVYIEPGMVFVWTPTADNTDDGVACIGSVAGGKVYVQACQA